jgi:hypothetical protein
MQVFYIMENHCLYKIQHFHLLVTLESEQLKVTALNLFHPTASPPFSKKCVFSYYDTLSKGRGFAQTGVNGERKESVISVYFWAGGFS